MTNPAHIALGGLFALLLLSSTLTAEERPEITIGPLRIGGSGSESLTVGRDIEVAEGEARRQAVVVAGDAVINGTIEGNLVVILGNVKLGPSARIGADLRVIGGSLDQDPSAVVTGDPVIIGLQGELGQLWMGRVQEWFLDGFLLLRPLPHGAGWAWVFAAGFLLLYTLLALLLPRPVQASVSALRSHPVSSFVVGLLSFLLIGPLLFLLLVSVVGMVVVPFLLAGLVTVYLFGKATLYEYAGVQLGRQLGIDLSRMPLIALLVGGLLICLLYAVPVVGFLVWSAVGTLGFGAVMMAVFQSLRTEQPTPVSVPSSVVNPPSEPAEVVGKVPPLTDSIELVPAGFWIRTAATAIDLLLVVAFVTVIQGNRGHGFFPFAWLLYHFGLWSWRGTTIGGLVLGIKIIRADGRLIDAGVALIRCLSAIFSAAILLLGFFWAGWDREKRSWHDKIAGTLVVRVPR